MNPLPTDSIHVMLDIEALGLNPGATVFQLGATLLDPKPEAVTRC